MVSVRLDGEGWLDELVFGWDDFPDFLLPFFFYSLRLGDFNFNMASILQRKLAFAGSFLELVISLLSFSVPLMPI